MSRDSRAGRLADVALVVAVLAVVSLGFVELYAAAGQTLGLFSTSAAFYDIYQSGQNPWAQATPVDDTQRLGRYARRH